MRNLIKQLEKQAEFTNEFVKQFAKENKVRVSEIRAHIKTIEAKRKAAKEKLIAKEAARKEAKELGVSIASLNELKTKAQSILEYFHTGHSMGCAKHLRVYRRNKPSYTLLSDYSRMQEYSNSSRYKAVHGVFTIHITLKQLKQIQLIEGVWTIRGEDNKASWLQAKGIKHTYVVSLVDGYLVGSSHGVTLYEATALEALKRFDTNKISKNRFVGYRHLKKLGACDAGINAFINRHNLNKNYGYRLDFLLSLEDNSFLKSKTQEA